MKMGKKLIVCILTGLLLLSLVACGEKPDSGDTGNTGNTKDPGTASVDRPAGDQGDNSTFTPSGTYQEGALFQYGLVTVKLTNNTAGFMDINGQWYIEPIYKNVKSFGPTGVAFVRTQEGWRCIDLEGNFVTDTVYDDVGSFSACGIARIVLDGKNGYFYKGENGYEHIILEECDYIWDFSAEGYAVAGTFNKAYGLLNSNFEWVLEPQEGVFLAIGAISNGLCAIEDTNAGKCGYIDTQGNWAITLPEYNKNKWVGYNFGDNGLAFYDGAFYDTSWNKVFSAKNHVVNDFTDSVWACCGKDPLRYYNAEGKEVLQIDLNDMKGFEITRPAMVADRMFLYTSVYVDDDGNVIGLPEADPGKIDYARDMEKVVINSKFEIVYLLRDKGLYDMSNYYTDGYAWSEMKDHVFAIVDSEGNIVFQTPEDLSVAFIGYDIREYSNIQ